MCYTKVATKTLKTLHFKEFHLSVVLASHSTERRWEVTSGLSYLLNEQPFICKGFTEISECLKRSFKVECVLKWVSVYDISLR